MLAVYIGASIIRRRSSFVWAHVNIGRERNSRNEPQKADYSASTATSAGKKVNNPCYLRQTKLLAVRGAGRKRKSRKQTIISPACKLGRNLLMRVVSSPWVSPASLLVRVICVGLKLTDIPAEKFHLVAFLVRRNRFLSFKKKGGPFARQMYDTTCYYAPLFERSAVLAGRSRA